MRFTELSDIFQIGGGQSAGLHLLADLCQKNEILATPRFRTIPTDLIRSYLRDSVTPKSLTELIEPLIGRKATLRWSGSKESFSLYASRGANSTIANPCLIITERFFEQIKIWLRSSIRPDHKALLVQAWVDEPGGIAFHAHGSAAHGVVELFDGEWSRISTVYREYGRTIECGVPGCSGRAYEDRCFKAVFDVLKYLARSVPFPCNLEGIATPSVVWGTQFRPIPAEFQYSPWHTQKLLALAESNEAQISGSASNVFDLVVRPVRLIEYLDDGKTDDALAVIMPATCENIPRWETAASATDVDSAQIEQLVLLGVPRDRAVRAAGRNPALAVWNHPIIERDLLGGRQIIFVSPEHPFVLQHHADQLPKAGSLRMAYKRIHMRNDLLQQLGRRRIHIVSDGYTAVVVPVE